jgi:hypothetical protein
MKRMGRQMIAYQGTCRDAYNAESHLCSGVKAHPEHDPDGVHLPLLVDGLHPPPKKPIEKTTVVELTFQRRLVVLPAVHGAEDLDDPGQDYQV